MPQGDPSEVLERVARVGRAANAFLALLRSLYRGVKEGDRELTEAAEKSLPQAFARLVAEAGSVIQFPGATNRKECNRGRKRGKA